MRSELDENLKEAMMTSVGLLQNCSFDEISKVITKALQQGQFIARKGKILPRGYTRETSERLFKALTKDFYLAH